MFEQSFFSLITNRSLILLLHVIFVCSLTTAPAWSNSPELVVKTIKTSNGHEFTVFYQGDLAMSFDLTRPKKSDDSVMFSIPCAFTDALGRVDGVYIENGSLHHRHFVSNQFGGAAVLQNGSIDFITTNKGALLTKGFLHDLASRKASLFQQFLLVTDGKASPFKDRSLFQRRAIVKFKDGQTAIFESKHALTLTTFGEDLKSAGVVNAIYTDMGAWDEGWYRDATGAIKVIGLDRSRTDKQSNWLTLRKRSKPLTFQKP